MRAQAPFQGWLGEEAGEKLTEHLTRLTQRDRMRSVAGSRFIAGDAVKSKVVAGAAASIGLAHAPAAFPGALALQTSITDCDTGRRKSSPAVPPGNRRGKCQISVSAWPLRSPV